MALRPVRCFRESTRLGVRCARITAWNLPCLARQERSWIGGLEFIAQANIVDIISPQRLENRRQWPTDVIL